MEKIEINPPSPMQAIFAGSRIYNPGAYDGDKLLPRPWDWPKNGFLSRRRRELREKNDGDTT